MRLIAGNNSKSDETFLPRTLLLMLLLLMLAVSVHLSPPALTSTEQRIRMQRTLCTARKGLCELVRERASNSLSLSLFSTDDDLVLFLNACHRAFSRTVTAAAAAVDAVVVAADVAEEEEEKETSKWAMQRCSGHPS